MDVFDSEDKGQQVLELNHTADVHDQTKRFSGLFISRYVIHLFQNVTTLRNVNSLAEKFCLVKIESQLLQNSQKTVFNFGSKYLVLPENVHFRVLQTLRVKLLQPRIRRLLGLISLQKVIVEVIYYFLSVSAPGFRLIQD